MTVQIVEVLRRAEQGATRPFICRGDDGEIYFVKGCGAGRRSQICEWVVSSLAKTFGLPVAPFNLVEVPEEILALDAGIGVAQLGAGPAFGSRQCHIAELTVAMIADIPSQTQQDVLVFDWWVRNGDRTLTEKGGNPNLFWEPERRALIVLDHNQSFDYTQSRVDLSQHHAFAGQRNAVFGDLYLPEQYQRRFQRTLEAWPSICTEVPAEWLFVDPEATVAVDFDFTIAYETLKDFERDDFWIWP